MKSFLGFLFLLSPLIIVVIWAILTWRGFRYGRQYLKHAGNQRKKRVALVIILGTIWFGASFWYSGGRKLVYDAVVLSLCAKDGGVKVYERVELPAERFDKWGKIQIPEKSKMKSKDEYYYESVTTYLRQGNPKLVRHYTKIVRKSDGEVLGESVHYGRGGGDLPGPWHPSGFTCPNPTKKPYLEPSIFQKGDF
jgi:hypothetical protein